MAEQTFFEEGNVKVTNARFMVGNTTHQLSQLNQVNVFSIPRSKAGPVWMIVIGGIMAVIGPFLQSAYGIVTLEVIGLGLITGAIFMLIFGFKPSYAVRFSTSSGQVNAITSQNKPYIEKIVQAINDAIASKV